MEARCKGDRGASAVEFALVAPILLMFLFGVIEYGNYFMTDLRATNGAMVGARAFAISDADPDDSSGWRTQARAATGSSYTFESADNCTGEVATAELPARSVAVTATSPYEGLFGDMIPHPSTVEARGVVRCER